MAKNASFTTAIFVRVTPIQRSQLHKAAKSAGLTLAAWLRIVATRAAQKELSR